MPRFVFAPVAITKGPMHAILAAISFEFIIMLIIFSVILAELEPRLIIFVSILSELALMAVTTEVKSVEPPPAPFAILAEFELTPAEFVPILTEFVLIPAVFVPMLIMFAVILSEFAPMAMNTEVKSVEPPPPAPFAIAAEFVLMIAAFD